MSDSSSPSRNSSGFSLIVARPQNIPLLRSCRDADAAQILAVVDLARGRFVFLVPLASFNAAERVACLQRFRDTLRFRVYRKNGKQTQVTSLIWPFWRSSLKARPL